MKIEIFTMNGGNGHMSASGAIAAVFKQRGISCRIIDIMNEVSRPGSLLTEAYNSLISSDLRLAAAYIRFAHAFPINKIYIFNELSKNRMFSIISRDSPDVIVLICPWLSDMVFSALRMLKGKRLKVVIVVVDFGQGMTRSWLDLRADLIILPTQESSDFLLNGRPMGPNIEVIGMPVHPDFYTDVPTKEEAKDRLGFKERTVTVLGGREGGMFNLRVLKELLNKSDDYEVVIQCGNNERLAKGAKALGNVKVLGFVKSMRDLMVASDVVVTKPGALTLTELITLRARFVVNSYPAIMSQEWGNVAYLQKHHIAPVCFNPGILPEWVEKQIEHRFPCENIDIASTEKMAERILSMVDR